MFLRCAILAVLFALADRATAQPVLPVIAPAAPPPAAARPAGEPVETPLEGIEVDAAEYARAFGTTLAEALRRLEAQEASVPLVDRLAEGYRDRLAGVVIEHQPGYRIVIVVTGAPSSETPVAVAPFGVPVILRTGALATRAQTLDAITRHQADIRAALPSPPGMGVDPRTGALLILIRPGDLDASAEAAIAARLQVIAGVPVEVRMSGDFDANLSVDGGGRLIGTEPGDRRHFLCTSGFVVTDGVRTALSTAAHCTDTLGFVDRSR